MAICSSHKLVILWFGMSFRVSVQFYRRGLQVLFSSYKYGVCSYTDHVHVKLRSNVRLQVAKKKYRNF